MRLTLRTLLAYLDDILEPAHAKEIGKKVAESRVASELVSRLKEVTRRRRLAAPDVTGPGSGLDANLVAEYLDNTLPPEKVADIEKICLESDVHLAEVAAAHQILALVLGEPVDIQTESRERMYALAPTRHASPRSSSDDDRPQKNNGEQQDDESLEAARDAVRFLSGSDPEIRQSETQATVGDSASTSPADDRIPEFTQKRPFWSISFPYVVVASIVAVWFGLLVLDPTLISGIMGGRTPKNDSNRDLALADNNTESPDAGNPVANGEQQIANSNTIDQTEGDAAGETEFPATDEMETTEDKQSLDEDQSVAGLDPLPPEDEPAAIPDTKSVKNGNSKSESSPDDSVATLDTTTNSGKSKPNSRPLKPTKIDDELSVPVPEGPELEYSSKEGVLLRYDTGSKSWLMLPHRSIVRTGEELASPAPFHAWLEVLQKTARVTMLEATRVKVLPPSDAALCGFNVSRGRLLFQANQPQVILSFAIGERVWRLELLTGDALCGLEVKRRLPNRYEEEIVDNIYLARLVVGRGTVRLSDGDAHVYMLDQSDAIDLFAEQVDSTEGSPITRLPLTEMPDWLNQENNKQTSIARRQALTFEKEFSLDQPVGYTIPSVMRYEDPQMSEFATRCMDLVGSGKDLALALSIDFPGHGEARLRALSGLQYWLTLDPSHREELKEELQKHFPREAATVYELIWGFSPDDLKTREASQKLVDWLQHDQLVIRELAFHYIRELTGRTNEYRPNAPANQRRSSFNRWQGQVEKDGALLK